MSSGDEPLVLIIGYGNPLRGDDGLGRVAAQRLSELLPASQAQIVTSHQLMPEMSEPASRAKLTVFIDASAADPPGFVREEVIEPPPNVSIRDSHQLGPNQLLGLARTLFGHSSRGILFSIGANDFELREGLSPAVASAVDQVVNRVVQLVRDLLGAANPL